MDNNVPDGIEELAWTLRELMEERVKLRLRLMEYETALKRITTSCPGAWFEVWKIATAALRREKRNE